MTDIVEKVFFEALRGTGWPVSQPPGLADNDTWLTFNTAGADGQTASNGVTRLRHTVQLHAYSHKEDGEHRTAFFEALAALRAAGVRVFSWGPDEYEDSTGVHHIACTCVWYQRN